MAATWIGCVTTLASNAARDYIRRARAGDMAAFEQIVVLHERMVLRTAQRLLDNPEDAKDAAQDVFIKLHAHLGHFREGSDLIPWLYRMTVNRCLDIRRYRRNRMPLPEIEIATSEPDPEEFTQAEQTKTILRAALNELPDRERTAIVLRDLEGCSTSEVAKILRSSESTVRSQISMGRRKLRDFFLRRGGAR